MLRQSRRRRPELVGRCRRRRLRAARVEAGRRRRLQRRPDRRLHHRALADADGHGLVERPGPRGARAAGARCHLPRVHRRLGLRRRLLVRIQKRRRQMRQRRRRSDHGHVRPHVLEQGGRAGGLPAAAVEEESRGRRQSRARAPVQVLRRRRRELQPPATARLQL